MRNNISDEHIQKTLQKALKQNFISADDTACIFYDLTFLEERLNNLIRIFPENTLHAIAVKANPLIAILHFLKEKNFGLEVATLPELYLAQKVNVESGKIVFDSPAKTTAEIEYAIENGVNLNADSFAELERISRVITKYNLHSNIGLRINPQIGIGTIKSTSVAGNYSKFGIPVTENHEKIIAAFQKHHWLNSIHLHIGSQGCSLKQLSGGVKIVYDLAYEINHMTSHNHQKIKYFDIGGGLPVDYYKEEPAFTLEDYTDSLKTKCPELFSSFNLITEFGRYIHANTGWVMSRVEYVKEDRDCKTAMIHVGADLFLRKCYRPDDWHHEIMVFDKNGAYKYGTDDKPYTIAGPLCFAGDMIAQNISLPQVNVGDLIIIQDTGAYTLSMWSRYNSRQIPKVLGYLENGAEFKILRKRERLHSLFEFWS